MKNAAEITKTVVEVQPTRNEENSRQNYGYSNILAKKIAFIRLQILTAIWNENYKKK